METIRLNMYFDKDKVLSFLVKNGYLITTIKAKETVRTDGMYDDNAMFADIQPEIEVAFSENEIQKMEALSKTLPKRDLLYPYEIQEQFTKLMLNKMLNL